MRSTACNIDTGDYTTLTSECLFLASPFVSLTAFKLARVLLLLLFGILINSSVFLSGLPPCKKKIIVSWSMPFMTYSRFLK